MQLPLTSLVPTVIELISFIEANWPHIWWFPNWYLGVPLRFVTGPVVPVMVIIIQKIFPISIEVAYLGIIGLMWLIGGIGVMLLVRELGGGKRAQWLSAFLFFLLPFHLWLLSFGTGLHHLSVALLPWIFVTYLKSIKTGKTRYSLVTAILLFLALLVDVSSILPIVVGFAVLVSMYRYIGAWEGLVIRGVLIFLTAFSVATIWYTPRLWLVLLGNPSFGGKPLSNVIPFILQLVQALMPLVLGMWVIQKRYRLTSKLMQFGVLFGGSFLFLTLIRFLSDVDFWMDWSSYFLELQLAIAIGGAVVNNRYTKRWYEVFLIILILTIIDGTVIFKLYAPNPTITSYKERITKMVGELVQPGESFDFAQGKRIFLSGSSVFWLGGEYIRVLSTSRSKSDLARGQNFLDPQFTQDEAQNVSISDSSFVQMRSAKILSPSLTFPTLGLFQVRGGHDEVSTHKTWAMGAYQIREGESSDLLKDWLMALGVSHILLHEKNSQEYYKDFRNLERFKFLTKVAEAAGDKLYMVDAFQARLADQTILNLTAPTEGSDEIALATYVGTLRKMVNMTYVTPMQIEMALPQPFSPNQVISLAVTFDRRWHVMEKGVRLTPDVLGNTVLVPANGMDKLTLEYQESLFDLLFGVVASGLCVVLLINSEFISVWIKQKLPSISSNELDEEQTY